MAVNPVGWSTTAASNTTVGGVSIAEGCSPANLNNGMRAIMAGVKETLDVLMGAKTTGGTANAQTLTTGLSLSAYAAGQAFVFKAGATNTGATTLVLDSLAAKAVTTNDGSALAGGDITLGGFYFVAYESGSDDFHLLNPGTGAVVTLTGTQTLTNKTLTSPVLTTPQINDTSADHQYVFAVSELTADRTVTLPLLTGNDTFVFAAFAATLTNKTINLADNTLTGTTAQFNTALSDDNFATLAGTETLTSKTIGAATLSGTMSAADQIIDQPVIRDYGETVNAIGSIGGGTQDIDLELGNVVTGTVDTSTTTFTFSNPPASGTAGSFTLVLTNGGSQTVNWPASVTWAGGIAPSLTAAGVDLLSFLTINAGTTWRGFVGGLAFS